ncbi:Rne/Rng family ribonuclease [Psychrobacter urativorans]|uniref:Rne/Rng family ribonuclease n=1 Tax=Psychrobacter urativorans TaxID=45610 RepID=UPI003BB53E31
MSEELLINVSPVESRVAVLDNGVLSEIYIERHHKLGLVGNIYLGTVVRVLPGMQAAFVEIGQSRTAFLHVNDMQREPRVLPTTNKALDKANKDLADDQSDSDKSLSDTANSAQSNSDQTNGNQIPDISAVTLPVVSSKDSDNATVASKSLIQHRLHEGQRVLVQVTKDQLGSKGARLTTNVSLPSRYLVYLPSSDHIGISQRIDNEEERTRLKTELGSLMQTVNLQGGLIARTAAERVPVDKLEEDIYYLLQLWRTICARKQEMKQHQSSELIYQELSLPLRSIRDLVHAGTEKVIVDNAQIYEQVCRFAKEFVPFIEAHIVHYTAEPALFDVHRVEEDLRDALKRRVDLKSGGYLIIDQTEAMTTIDVNTGSYVGGRSLEDTVYKTNLEATHAIASQLRLRNLGGIIILDFIDMLEQEHKDDVLTSLREQLTQDYAKTNITQVSELGLVEMTRKRTRESLGQLLCEPCLTCQGRGFVKTAETVCFEIFREIMRCARTYNSPKKFTVVAHAAVIDLLLTSEADTVADLEYLLGRVITFEVENLYTQEQYDIVLD